MSKKVILIVVVLFLIVGGGSAGAYYYVSNTPKNLYLSSELKSYKSIEKYMEKRFKPEYTFKEELMDNSYDTTVTLGARAPKELLDALEEEYSDSYDSYDSDAEYRANNPSAYKLYRYKDWVEEGVNGSTIKLNVAHDPKKATSIVSLTPNLLGVNFGKIAWSANKDYQYLEGSVLKNPISVKNDAIIKGIKKIANENFNVGNRRNITNDKMDLNSILDSMVKDNDSKELLESYMKFIVDQIDASKFTKGKGSVSILGNKEELNNVTLSLNSADVKKIVVAVLEKAKDDEKLEKIVQSIDPSINYNEELKEIIPAMKEMKNDISFKSVIYLDGKDIQKREISMTQNKDTVSVIVDTLIDKDIDMKIEIGGENSDPAFILEGSSKGKDIVKDNYTITTNSNGEKSKIRFTNDEKLDGNKRTNDIELTMEDESNEPYKVNFKNEADTDGKNNTQKTTGELSFKMNDSLFKVLIDSETKLKVPVKVDINNAQDVNDMSKSDIEKLRDDMNSEYVSYFENSPISESLAVILYRLGFF